MATKALPQEIFRTAFATRTQERDFKVGAAGELYMFEHLKGLGLPRFGLENWKSEIRDRVKIHADYHDLDKYNDRTAIADFEYLDDSGRLTQFLKRKGHLAKEFSDSGRPLYHIEIKTTTSSNRQEPFFMSKAQERHIQDKRVEVGKRCSSIYMICRIFNLGKGDETGMHVYLDPETKRRNRELEFSTHTWAVRPLMHPTMQVENSVARASAAPTTGIVATPAEQSGDTETKDARQDAGVPNFANFGSSDTSSVSRNSAWTSASSTLDPQKKTESLGGSLFGSNLAPSSNNASLQLSPRSTLLGMTKSPSTLGIFSDPHIVSPNSDTSKPLSLGLFGSNATSSNGGVSNATPMGGLFGANATFDNFHASKAISTGPLFGAAADSDVSKGAPPSTTSFSGFGSSSSNTIPKAPSASTTGFSGFRGSSSSSTSKAPTANTTGVFGVSNNTTSKAPIVNTTGGFGVSSNTTSKATTAAVQISDALLRQYNKEMKEAADEFDVSSNTTSMAPTANTTGFSGFGVSSSTTSKAPSVKGLFVANNGSPSSDSSRAPFTSSLFGNKAVSSNSETLNSTSSIFALGTAEPLPSAKTGGLFHTSPSPSDTQTPRTTATGTSTAAVQPFSSTKMSSAFGTAAQSSSSNKTSSACGKAAQPSSLTRTSFFFGTGAPSTVSEPSQSTTGPFRFGISPSTPRAVFGTKTTTSTNHNALGVPTSMPSASNLFSVSRDSSTRTAFGSTNNTETASTSRPMTSTTPSFLTSPHPVPTDNHFLSTFQAGHRLNKDSISAHQSRSPSPTPTQRPRSSQAEASREASPKPAPAEAKALAAETQPAATRDGETQTGD